MMNTALPIHDNLPSLLSTFVGRKREIAEVKRLMSGQRLVTLTGPGGCGKTRLAIQAAGELRETYPDGIWLVELAALVDAALLPGVVASVLSVREQPGSPVAASLRSYLQARHLLLVLDNCEHMIEACAHLSAMLLESCPDLRLLATSREPLGVPGEVVWSVPPLSLPEPQPWQSPGSDTQAFSVYEQSEAVQLFAARAQAAWREFELSRQNATWVAAICRRLDGMPLAIELAAARVRTYPVRQIWDHLSVDFQLLSQGPRTVLPRQQTLKATLDWSHALLSPEEQVILRRLAVFMGGWTEEAAEQVVAEDLGNQQGIAALSNLVDKSLVQVEQAQGEARYRFLETIRLYAWGKMEQAGEAEAMGDRHLGYFMRWAEYGETQLAGRAQLEWVRRFDAEHENIRSALHWSRSREGRAEAGLRLAGACALYWKMRGYFAEGRRHLEQALEAPGAHSATAPRAHALLGAAKLAYFQSDYPATQLQAEESLSIYRSLGVQGLSGAGWVLELLGELSTEVGDYEQATVLMGDALAIFQELKDKDGIATISIQLGWAYMRAGEYERAATLLDEGLVFLRLFGDSYTLGFALAGIGELAVRRGDFDRAVGLLEESLALRREIGHPWGVAAALGSLGWVALRQRDMPRMRSLLQESLLIRQEISDLGGTAWCLEKLAEAACIQAQGLPAGQRRQELVRAARVFAAAQALRVTVESVIDPADEPEYSALLAAIKAELGDVDFATAWSQGKALPLPEIVNEALASPAETRTFSTGQAAKARFGGLSRREREVAQLIAHGRSNREIADIMSVGTKTIETYVTRILHKLNFQSRVQIATWAVEVGLQELNPDEAP